MKEKDESKSWYELLYTQILETLHSHAVVRAKFCHCLDGVATMDVGYQISFAYLFSKRSSSISLDNFEIPTLAYNRLERLSLGYLFVWKLLRKHNVLGAAVKEDKV